MARHTNKPDFKKNDPRINRNGRPRLLPEQLSSKKLTRERLEIMLSKYIDMSLDEMKEASKNSKLPVLELYIIRILLTGMVDADTSKVDFILNRLLGKVKEQVEHSGNMQITHGRLIDMIEEKE